MASISIRQVVKRYGRGAQANQVIHGVSAEIADGEFIVIVGPSGCGKSTLLRMVAGLEEITEGQIAIGDRVVNDVEPADRDIAMVFQNYALYPHMSVYDNMAYGLKIKGVPKDEIRRRVEKAASILELAHLLDRKPRQLSGGQRQRVAMGRAIVRQPQVFLFDEPLSNLDAKLREEMQFELRQIQRKVGTTTVMVTHDQSEAMSISDRVVVMEGGRATQIDHPHRVYEHPSTRFISTFVGKANLLPGRVTACGTGSCNVAVGPLAVEVGEGGYDSGAAVLMSVRPEKLQLVPAGSGRLDGTVQERFFLGSQWLYRLATPAGELMVLSPNDGRAALDEGDAAGIDWPAHCTRLLRDDEAVAA